MSAPVSNTPQPHKRDWTRILVFAALVAVLGIASAAAWNGLSSAFSQASATSQPPASVQDHPYSAHKMETVDGNTVFVTEEEYNSYVAEAQAQYKAALKRGRPTYTMWAARHKVSLTSEKAARTFICQSDYGDSALYAATMLDEGELTFAIDDVLVTIPGYNPEDVKCQDGKPLPEPRLPKPSVQPKDPSNNPPSTLDPEPSATATGDNDPDA